ncbi:MAG TPA: hypothetical protein VN408_34340 [Actinoplanes sp.]|nr:hypothetical protein [Actinoplanes sp.]
MDPVDLEALVLTPGPVVLVLMVGPVTRVRAFMAAGPVPVGRLRVIPVFVGAALLPAGRGARVRQVDPLPGRSTVDLPPHLSTVGLRPRRSMVDRFRPTGMTVP